VRIDNQRARDQLCAQQPSGPVNGCEMAIDTVEVNRNFEPNGVELGEIAMAMRTFPGVLTFVSHQLATGFGWLMLGLLAAIHLARERASGSVGQSVLRAGRSRYLAAKVASLFVAAVAGLLGATVALYVLRPTYAAIVRVPTQWSRHLDGTDGPLRTLPADPHWSTWSSAGRSALSGLAVVLVVCCVFGLVASLFRQPVTAAVVLGGLVLAMFLAVQWWDHGTWVPEMAISRWLQVDGSPFGLTDIRLWDPSGQPADLYGAPHRVAVPVASSIAWVVGAVAASAAAARAFVRRDVL
jgi:hypothetical protein